MNGTAHVPEDYAIWTLLSFEGDPSLYLTSESEIPVNNAGEWTSTLTIGRGPCDEGSQYAMYLAAFPRGITIEPALAQRPDGQFSVRYASMPNFAILLDFKPFTLENYYLGTRNC